MVREHGDAVVLIGFSGSGKSSAGRELAARTYLPCYDTDEMICMRTGRTITQIFEEQGEAAFREMESAALREIPEGRAIIVTGGGLILRPENAQLIRERGQVIYLQAHEEALAQRTQRQPTRPLLRSADPRRTISALLRAREPLYARLADEAVDTTTLTPTETAEAIMQLLGWSDESRP